LTGLERERFRPTLLLLASVFGETATARDGFSAAAAIAGGIKVCNAFLAHSYHAAIFALQTHIPTMLFARTEYYQLEIDALRSAFEIPFPLIAPRDLADRRIARMLERISQSSRSHGMTSADGDAWLDSALPRHPGGVSRLSIAWFDRSVVGIAG
jgi:hypothetical protein